jgi:hypothetical protein
MRKDFLIYEEMRKYFPIYEEAVSHIRLCNCSILNFLILYEENLIFFLISVVHAACALFDAKYLHIMRVGGRDNSRVRVLTMTRYSNIHDRRMGAVN